MFRSVLLKRGLITPSRSILRSSQQILITKPTFNNGVFIGLNNVRFNSTVPPTPNNTEIVSELPSFTDDAVSTATQMSSDTIGYLQSVGLPGNWFKGIFEHSLEYIHVYTGLPWWVTIVVATLAFRMALLPLSIKVSDNMAKNQKAKPELDAIKAKINSPELSDRNRKLLQKQMFAIMRKHGIKQRYMIAPFLQMATSIGFFLSIREMCLLPVQGFENQGAYWFTDLVATDPYAALPIISAIIYLGTIYRGGEAGELAVPSTFRKFMIFMPVLSIPFTMQLSAGVAVYLTTTAIFSAFQINLLANKSARKALGIAPFVKAAAATTPGGFVGATPAKPSGIKASLTDMAENFRKNSEAKAKQFEQVNEAHNRAQVLRAKPKAIIRERRKS